MKLDDFRLERYLAEYEFTAPHVLCASDCESMPIRDLLAMEPGAEDRFLDLRLGYTESLGHPDLREAIATLYTGIDPDQVLVHAGAEEAIFNLMNVVLDTGDHVVVHTPFYQSLGEVARSLGARVDHWQGQPGDGWRLELDRLASMLTPGTRLVVVNVPHNPTGFLPDPSFWRALSDLSAQHGFLIFSDEVYRGLEYDAGDRLPSMAEVNPRAAALGVMSKTYGLAGLRIGWVVTQDRRLYRRLAAFKDYTTICSSGPSEFLAELALRHRDSIVRRNLGIIRGNLDRLDAFFERHRDRFQWIRPRAGSIAFPGLLRGSVEAFCRELREEAGVLLLPGSVYGPGYDAVRIGFGRADLPRALQRLEAHLRTPARGGVE
jgi:aspartate/methionine/tyrosine aminotransferase